MKVARYIFIPYLLSSLLAVCSHLQADEANPKGFDTPLMTCALTMAQQAAGLPFDAKVDKTSYKIGDALTLEVIPEQDTHISVLDQGSEDKKRGHSLFENVFIKKGETYTFPPPNSGKLEVSGPAGTNTFEVIASQTPLADPAANSKAARSHQTL